MRVSKLSSHSLAFRWPALGSYTLLFTDACSSAEIEAIIAKYEVTEPPGSSSESSASHDTSTSNGTSTGTETGSSGTSTSEDQTTTAGSGSGDSSGTTGPAPPVCGDGIVEGEETCDDGNDTPGDGCQACAGDSLVFVTSEVYQGFALGGLHGADLRCQSLAAKADLPRFLTFKAWLSTSAVSASDRMLHSPGRYVLVNNLIVAQNWDALTSGTLENPIAVDENSQTREDSVWTGTLPDGQPALGSSFCGEWDDEEAFNDDAGFGYSLSTDGWWSFFDYAGCGNEARLYCVEQRQGAAP